MPDYRTELTQYLEEVAVKLLKRIGVNAQSNNKTNITDVDLITGYGVTIDVQYSADFAKWGDIRLDIVSAYSVLAEYQTKSRFDLQKLINTDADLQKSESLVQHLHKFIEIKKSGKLYQSPAPDQLFYMVYNHHVKNINDVKNIRPYAVFLVKTSELTNYLETNWKTYCSKAECIKLNMKEHLGDKHGSAFFALPLADLLQTGFIQKIPLKQH